jgi:hypothetical protein
MGYWFTPKMLEQELKSGDLLVIHELFPEANELKLQIVLNGDVPRK